MKIRLKSKSILKDVVSKSTKEAHNEQYEPKKEKIPAKDMHSALTGGKAPFVEKAFIPAKHGATASSGFHLKQ